MTATRVPDARRRANGRRTRALLWPVLMAIALGGCDEPERPAPPEALDLESASGRPPARAALAAAARDEHPRLEQARRLGVTECRRDSSRQDSAVYCYVEFTAYPGNPRSFCTRTYETTMSAETAEPASAWPVTCLRYTSRKAARKAREGKVSRRRALRQGADAAAGS